MRVPTHALAPGTTSAALRPGGLWRTTFAAAPCQPNAKTPAAARGLAGQTQAQAHPTAPGAAQQAPGVTQKLTYLWREYGVVGVSTYLGIYVSTLATLYAGVSAELARVPDGGRSGVLDAVFGRIDRALAPFPFVHKTLGLHRIQTLQRDHPRASAFAMAWVLAKLTEPVRLAVALAVVPRIARALRR